MPAEQILHELHTIQRERSALEARHFQLHLAEQLTERLPSTLDAMATGKLDLPKAEDRTVAQMRATARYHRDRIDPEAAERRRQLVAERRSVSFTNHADGEAALSIQGPGDRVYLAWIVIDTLARKLRSTGDKRTLDELCHDIALDLILGKFNSHIQVQAFLHVPALTLAGIGDDPGILAGYGPVTAARCRQLASRDAMWHQVFCDPVTGVVKDLDRKTYRPPASLARYVEVRDGTCVAPGCQRPADRCQLDHTLRWAVGCRNRS